jgi:hypothetical protein
LNSPEDEVPRQLEQAELVSRELVAGEEDRLVLAPEGVGRGRAEDRGDDDRGEHADREIAEEDLEHEEDARDGRVEDRRDAGGGAAAHERADMLARDVQHAAEHRAGGRPDLDDRPLGAGRSPAADRRDGGEDLDDADARADLAVALDDRLEDLGHPVPLGLAGESPDKQGADEGARHGDGGEQPQGELAPGLVGVPLDLVEQPGEADRPERGEGADAGTDDDEVPVTLEPEASAEGFEPEVEVVSAHCAAWSGEGGDERRASS